MKVQLEMENERARRREEELRAAHERVARASNMAVSLEAGLEGKQREVRARERAAPLVRADRSRLRLGGRVASRRKKPAFSGRWRVPRRGKSSVAARRQLPASAPRSNSCAYWRSRSERSRRRSSARGWRTARTQHASCSRCRPQSERSSSSERRSAVVSSSTSRSSDVRWRPTRRGGRPRAPCPPTSAISTAPSSPQIRSCHRAWLPRSTPRYGPPFPRRTARQPPTRARGACSRALSPPQRSRVTPSGCSALRNAMARAGQSLLSP